MHGRKNIKKSNGVSLDCQLKKIRFKTTGLNNFWQYVLNT